MTKKKTHLHNIYWLSKYLNHELITGIVTLNVCMKMFFFAGPNEIYHTQITTNINYSYWMKDGVQQESWTQNEHHPRVNSEMTR